jgi:hypothetical protein
MKAYLASTGPMLHQKTSTMSTCLSKAPNGRRPVYAKNTQISRVHTLQACTTT